VVSSPPPSEDLSGYLYYHWKPLTCGGSACLGKVTETDTEVFKRETTDEDLTRSRVTYLAQTYLDQKTEIGVDVKDPAKDAALAPNTDVSGRIALEASLLSRLESEYFHETSHKVVTSEEQTHSLQTIVDFGSGYGFVQQCVYVKFKDTTVPCVVLASELRQRSDPFLSTSVTNLLNDPDANYDATFWDLASNLISITPEMRQSKNISKFNTFELPDVNFLYIDLVNIWEVDKRWTLPNVAGSTDRDSRMDAEPLPTCTDGYGSPHCIFRAPLTEVIWDSNWKPLYEYFDGKRHHFSTQHREEGINSQGGTILCYVAEDPHGDPNLLPVYSYEDSKFHDHRYTMIKDRSPWINERIIGYAYACP
jgi:hypothetical protein